MPTPPTLISYSTPAVTPWTNSGATRATPADVSYQVGDVVVVLIGAEVAAATLGVTDITGLAFGAAKVACTTAGTCSAAIFAAVATDTASNQTITCSNTNSGNHWGLGVWVWRGSAGIGTSVEQHTSTKTKALVPTGADGAIMWGIFDFNADGALSGTPTPTNTRISIDDGTSYSLGVFDLVDQTSAGSVNYGGTGGGATGPFTIVAIEVKAAAAGGSDLSVSFGTIGEPVVGGSTF